MTPAIALITSCVLGAAACVAGEPAGEPPPAAIAKQSSNSLGEHAIARYVGELLQLADGPFADGSKLQALTGTEAGLQLVSYSARCMLDAGDSLVVTSHRGPVTIPIAAATPSLGLAGDWRIRGLTAAERRWLTGCLLAHVNAVGATVGISVRGPHPALATTAAERSQFPYLEGAFYGELTESAHPGDVPRLTELACYGPALAQCGSIAPTLLWNRLCTLGDCERLTIVGPCEQTAGPAACAPRTGDAYDRCYDTPRTSPPPSGAYTAGVVTTYLPTVDCSL